MTWRILTVGFGTVEVGIGGSERCVKGGLRAKSGVCVSICGIFTILDDSLSWLIYCIWAELFGKFLCPLEEFNIESSITKKKNNDENNNLHKINTSLTLKTSLKFHLSINKVFTNKSTIFNLVIYVSKIQIVWIKEKEMLRFIL